VKPATEAVTVDALATQAGFMIGTPGYIAPEVALSTTVDARADLYAAGCVAYYLLTGRQVFEGGTVMQVFAHHLQTPPAPPSQFAGAVPPDLDELVLDCLAKDPEDRPESAAALDRRLARIAVEVWTDELARQWWAVAASGSGGSDPGAGDETRAHSAGPRTIGTAELPETSAAPGRPDQP